MHRREGGLLYYVRGVAAIVGLLLLAVAMIVLGLVVVGALFLFVIEHGWLD